MLGAIRLLKFKFLMVTNVSELSTFGMRKALEGVAIASAEASYASTVGSTLLFGKMVL